MGIKKEPIEPTLVEEELDEPTPARESKANCTPIADGEVEVCAAEPETYTLTAEEFHAAKAHIEALQKEKDETVALLQRIQADFDNFRRRNATVRAESGEEGKRDCIRALLPVLDNFERAMEHADACDEGWREGVALVQRQFCDALSKLGLEEIPADGAFDPTLHEAVAREKVEGRAGGEVLLVLQKGYRVGERILRHSMVKVTE